MPRFVYQVHLARVCFRNANGDVGCDLEHLFGVKSRPHSFANAPQGFGFALFFFQFGAELLFGQRHIAYPAVTIF